MAYHSVTYPTRAGQEELGTALLHHMAENANPSAKTDEEIAEVTAIAKAWLDDKGLAEWRVVATPTASGVTMHIVAPSRLSPTNVEVEIGASDGLQ